MDFQNREDLLKYYFPTASNASTANSGLNALPTSQSAEDGSIMIIKDLVNAIQSPPPQVTSDYVNIIARASTFIGNPIEHPNSSATQSGAQATWTDSSFPEQTSSSGGSVTSPTNNGSSLDSQEKMRNAANMGRNNIFDLINEVNSFIARARNAGFAPENNPFLSLMRINDTRVAFEDFKITGTDALSYVYSINKYLNLLDAEKSGKLNLDSNSIHATQISSARFSLDGFGGSGDSTLDLSKLLPDADEIREQKVNEALSIFDFSKRIPKMLFTAFYSPDSIPKGVLVGWKKVPDASGYAIKRTSFFDGSVVDYTVTSEDIVKMTDRLSQYTKTWVLSFYDSVKQDTVLTFLDTNVAPDNYYFYKIKAYQLQNDNPGQMFLTDSSPYTFSKAKASEIKQRMLALDPTDGENTISPYPLISQAILGTTKYDWLLAALNIRKSIERNDSRTVTRNYSYLSAQIDFILQQSSIGRFFIPRDVNSLQNNVMRSVSKFGVNQILKEILQETGTLFYFEGKDPSDNSLFRNISSVSQNDSGVVSIVISAIDPETLTLDLNSLSTNLPKLIQKDFVGVSDGFSEMTPTLDKRQTSSEIQLPVEFDGQKDLTGVIAEDEIQFLQRMGDNETILDLTTFDGISSFMKAIRILSDVGPNRGLASTSTATKYVPDPISLQEPASPPVQPSQPAQPSQENGADAVVDTTPTAGTSTDQNGEDTSGSGGGSGGRWGGV